jgi:hypothetical protein
MRSRIRLIIYAQAVAALLLLNSGTMCGTGPIIMYPEAAYAQSGDPEPDGSGSVLRSLFHKPAADIMKAFKRAYPDRVAEAAIRNNDWALRIDNTWFYWAGGRLLPEDSLSLSDEYTPYPFYFYPRELPPIPVYTAEQKQEIYKRLNRREDNPPRRHPGIYNALWRIKDKATSWERVKDIYFLGKKTQVHRDLLEELAAVEEEILEIAKSDPDLQRFIAGLTSVAGYTWRPIAGTNSLSAHSYGIAIDIIPRNMRKRITYWRWQLPYDKDWFLIPYEKRFMPPDSFIRAFENHGFVWGGKWFYFDTIHFEYRPEILILNGWDLK